MNLSLTEISKSLPKPDLVDYRSMNYTLFGKLEKTCVVIDDDPTGSQTVYDIPLLTDWSVPSIKAEFTARTRCFYILTNSRSLDPKEAYRIYLEIGENVLEASRETSRDFIVISRSDSTLRGHFPTEVNALLRSAFSEQAIIFFTPVMFEGGRVTYEDVHHMIDGDHVIPVDETAFSNDDTFGYKNANLKLWVEEKTDNKIPRHRVRSISITEVREGSISDLVAILAGVDSGDVIFPNALEYGDLDKVAHALLIAFKKNSRLAMIRSSSSLVPSIIGQPAKPLIPTSALNLDSKNGGLVVVGSYVPKSTEQLDYLLARCVGEESIELPVDQLLEDQSEWVVSSAADEISRKLEYCEKIVVYTSRQLVTGHDALESLSIGARVSQALVNLVKGLKTKPKYIIAKGGITSNDIAVKALGMRRSKVRGQIIKGVPVWEMGAETRYAGLPYIVFPGNVGDSASLHEIVQKLGQ